MKAFFKPIVKKTSIAVSAFALCLILCPVQLKISLWAVFSVLFACLFTLYYARSHFSAKPGKLAILFDVMALIVLANVYYYRGLTRLSLITLASIINVPVASFVLVISAVSALLAIPSLSVLHSILFCKTKRLADCFERKLSSFPDLYYAFCLLFQLLILCSIQFFSLQYCAAGRKLILSISSWFAGVLLLLFINCALAVLFRKWKIALIISSAIFFLWNVGNYYTSLFHGSPLYISEFANAGTAAAVALNYSYKLSWEIIIAVLILIAEILFIKDNTYFTDSSLHRKKRILLRSCILVSTALLFIPTYRSVIKKHESWMPWEQSINNCGFLLMNINDLQSKKNTVNEPAGYSLSALSGFAAENPLPDKTHEYPDIILILNETLCDLEYYTELGADKSALGEMYAIEGITSGYAVTPNIGGGTNNSEFELLMSKSNYLLKNGAPFTFLSDQQLERSIVQYLNDLGYSTTGMHCADGKNYNRNVAYPEMGFDTVAFGEESFAHKYEYGSRMWTDLGNYEDLIDLYEKDHDGPRFYYLLTYQNHGGYEQNGPELDTVHVANDFGGLTDDIEEYLSSISLSAEAFRKLTEYFDSSERDVIICMVGDHAPSFISSLPYTRSENEHEKEIAKRTVPYVIWSNYDVQFEDNTEYVSMTDLVPMLLDAADMPMTTFYSFILKLHDILPVRTSNGIVMDKYGNTGIYSSDSPYYDILSKYYYLEYNSLLSDEEYFRDLFELR